MTTQNMPSAPSTVFSAQDARLLRYQDVLAKMSSQRQFTTNQLSAGNTPNISDGWISEEDDVEDGKGQRSVKSKAVGPLIGGFADAEAVD